MSGMLCGPGAMRGPTPPHNSPIKHTQPNTPQHRDVHRRYSNFIALHTTLLATYPHAHPPPPPLPPKRWFRAQHPHFVERRRAALEAYLEGLLANETLRKSKEVRIFLGLGGAFGAGLGSFGLGLHRHSSAASSSLLTALAEAGTSSNNNQPPAVPTPAASSAGTTAAASSSSSSSSSSSLAAAAADPERESALFSFPYAGGSFAGEGKALGGGFKKGALGLNLGLKNKVNKAAAGAVSAAEEARDAWTDLVAVTTTLAQAKGAAGHDEKQDGKQLPQQEEEGQGGGSAAAVAVEAPRALCSIM